MEFVTNECAIEKISSTLELKICITGIGSPQESSSWITYEQDNSAQIEDTEHNFQTRCECLIVQKEQIYLKDFDGMLLVQTIVEIIWKIPSNSIKICFRILFDLKLFSLSKLLSA